MQRTGVRRLLSRCSIANNPSPLIPYVLMTMISISPDFSSLPFSRDAPSFFTEILPLACQAALSVVTAQAVSVAAQPQRQIQTEIDGTRPAPVVEHDAQGPVVVHMALYEERTGLR